MKIIKNQENTSQNQLLARSVLGLKNASFDNSCEEKVQFYMILGWQNSVLTPKRRKCRFFQVKTKNGNEKNVREAHVFAKK